MDQSSKKQKVKVRINMTKNNSNISEFIKRQLPTDHELEEFEEIIEEKQKQEEINDSLSEIYQNDDENLVNMHKFDVKKKKGFLFWFFSFLIFASLITGIGHGIYYYLTNVDSDATAIEFAIQGKDKVMAGEEFFWTIKYKNLSRVSMSNVSIKAVYPDNFIFLESVPEPQIKNFTWHFDKINANQEGTIQIKGKIIGEKNASAILLADMTYMPENFTSTFKKEASYITSISDIGVDFDFEYSPTALMNEDNNIAINLTTNDNNFLQDFFITTTLPENIELISLTATSSDNIKDVDAFMVEQIKPNIWHVSGIKKQEQKLEIKYKVNQKIDGKQDMTLTLWQTGNDEQMYIFLEKKISVEIMQSNLNLTLIINGSKNDQTIDFGENLTYSIVYANKGEVDIKNVMIMAVLEGDFFDWTSLDDKNNGIKKNNTIIWSKNEIPNLTELEVDQEEIIDFSINVANFKETDIGKDFQIKSYAQFDIAKNDDDDDNNDVSADEPVVDKETNTDNRSNIIANRINSDFLLKESVRYFNEDDVPVGAGPLPFKIGQATSLKVYWTITNNLHELRDAKVEVNLPDNIHWNNKNSAEVGSVQYDNEQHKITWQIGRLPITVYKADAEFSISITPTINDVDKIMVLLPGSNAHAIDNKTSSDIIKTTKTKTTKLEDDETAMGISDGRVVE